MNILCLSDIHGAVSFFPFATDVLSWADIAVLTGDITNFGDDLIASRIIETVSKHVGTIVAVSGNCDNPSVGSFLLDSGIFIEQRIRLIDGIQFGGVGGSLPCPGRTPNEKTDFIFRRHLDILAKQIDPNLPFVFVSHQPPKNTALDKTITGAHVGSMAVREFVSKYNPLIAFFGHIHESSGTDSLNDTQLVSPGPFREGRYAQIRIEKNKVAEIGLHSL